MTALSGSQYKPPALPEVADYLLSMGRLAVYQFIMKKYITPFTFTDLKL